MDTYHSHLLKVQQTILLRELGNTPLSHYKVKQLFKFPLLNPKLKDNKIDSDSMIILLVYYLFFFFSFS
jgi:hypothetical protein